MIAPNNRLRHYLPGNPWSPAPPGGPGQALASAPEKSSSKARNTRRR